MIKNLNIMPHFDYYIIHPSIVTIKNQLKVLETINALLVADESALILIENPKNFIGNTVLQKPYARFLSNMEKLEKLFQNRIVMILGQSVLESAKQFINSGNSLCFLNFPYAELRSLHIPKKEDNIGTYMAFNFENKPDNNVFDLSQSDGKFLLEMLDEVEYMPICTQEDLSDFEDVKVFVQTLSASIYLYKENGCKKLIKSLRTEFTKDYFFKIDDLIQVRRLFERAKVLEALPQKILEIENKKRGIICNYIEGVALEKLYYDNCYERFMTQNFYKANLANRIYIAITLCKTITTYHSVGIYFSDIKGDNFIVTNQCEVIPIDCDGFSYYRYYSSCPREEMIPNPKKNRKKSFLQNEDFERYAVFVMMYRFFMAGNLPLDDEENIFHIQDRSKMLEGSERGKKLMERWFLLPNYIREILYNGICRTENYTIDILLKRLIRWYIEITEKQVINEWISECVKSEYFFIPEDNENNDIAKHLVLETITSNR